MRKGESLVERSQGTLRGTQSMVGVMGLVWKRPLLTLIEVCWRWSAAVPLLWLAWHVAGPTLRAVPVHGAALEGMSFLDPARSAGVLVEQAGRFSGPVWRLLRWWAPLAVLVWSGAAAAGRGWGLQLAEPAFRSRWPVLWGWSLVRAVLFALLLGGWGLGVAGAVRSAILAPAARGAEPSVVVLTAEAVVLTLGAFLLWSLGVWWIDRWPLERGTGVRPATAGGRSRLRGKLVETNLVMGIVRVALLVLLLTFSASPLPFQTQETATFIDAWWVFVALLYVVGSDFFHVVRRVTYLRLLQSFTESPTTDEGMAS